MAKQEKIHPKPSKILSLDNLRSTWKESPDSTGAGKKPGIDNKSALEYKQNIETNTSNLHKKIMEGDFSFRPLKAWLIPKQNGKNRVICTPTVEDRLVQRAILSYLETKHSNKIFSNVSYGGTQGRGVHTAIDRAILERNKSPWVVKTDIEQFFDKIPRAYLKAQVRNHIKIRSLIPFLESIIDSEIQPKNDHQKKEIKANGIEAKQGLRQGMPLSPALSNLVLFKFDQAVISNNIKMIRYADDIICFCKSEDQCKKVLAFIEDELKKLTLAIPDVSIEDSKTSYHKPDEGVEFLGVKIYKQGQKYKKKIPQAVFKKAQLKITDHSTLKYNLDNKFSLKDVLSRLENIPDGYKNAYKDCTNLKALEDELRKKASETKKQLLSDIFGENIIETLSEDKIEFLGF